VSGMHLLVSDFVTMDREMPLNLLQLSVAVVLALSRFPVQSDFTSLHINEMIQYSCCLPSSI